MPKNFIFCIGIAIYHLLSKPHIKNLKGCENDAKEFAEYVENLLKNTTIVKKILTNENATRQAVIDYFKFIIENVSKGDKLIFYYSGHGSWEKANKLFLRIDPTGINQTLVLYDSRIPGNYDLADKELNYLLAQITAKEVEVTVIYDCCFSGGMNRDETPENPEYNVKFIPRETSINDQPRPLDSYIFYCDNLEKNVNKLLLEDNYLMLTACRDDQVALEKKIAENKFQGLFSYYLMKILKKKKGFVTYQYLKRELFRELEKEIVDYKFNEGKPQVPQLKYAGLPHPNQIFLSNAIESGLYFTLAYFNTNQANNQEIWFIDAGVIHGIPVIAGNEKIRLVIFSPDQEIFTLNNAIATGEIIEVLANISKVNIAIDSPQKLDKNLVYLAFMIDWHLTKLQIYIKGEETKINKLSNAIKTANFNEQPSLYISAFDDSIKELDIKLSASEKKQIINAVSWREENAEKVIKKVHKLKGDKLTQLLTKIGTTEEYLNDFGYWETAKNVYVEYETDSELRDTENIPLNYQLAPVSPSSLIHAYFLTEVRPHVEDAWLDLSKTNIGYEISFNKYFYHHESLRSLAEVTAEMLQLEEEMEGLLKQLVSFGDINNVS